MPVILATWEAEIRRIMVGCQPAQIVWETLAQKISNTKKIGRMYQVIEHLPSKHEALSSNPSTTKKKKKTTKK
jgi:hypothetical protein